MTPSELKSKVKSSGNPTIKYFFDNKTMKFFGDTMKNYGVRDSGECWELYRKHPVNGGLTSSSYFSKETFERIFK